MQKPTIKAFRILVHLGSWVPLLILIWDGLAGTLSANPIQTIEQRTGQYAIIWLMLSLACTPLATLTGINAVRSFRRALGLYAFAYAMIHFLTFFILDYGLNLKQIFQATVEKPFILVGTLTLLTLLPLAITSTRASMRRLGKKWGSLHRIVYAAGILAVIHYLWAVKSDIRQPLLYGSILLILLVLRLPPVRRWIISVRTPKRSQLPDG